MVKKIRLKYKRKGIKKGGVCEISVKSAKEDLLLLTIRRMAESFTGQCVITVLKNIKQAALLGAVRAIKRKWSAIVADLKEKT